MIVYAVAEAGWPDRVAEEAFAQTYLAVQFDRVLRAGPTFAAKLRGG